MAKKPIVATPAMQYATAVLRFQCLGFAHQPPAGDHTAGRVARVARGELAFAYILVVHSTDRERGRARAGRYPASGTRTSLLHPTTVPSGAPSSPGDGGVGGGGEQGGNALTKASNSTFPIRGRSVPQSTVSYHSPQHAAAHNTAGLTVSHATWGVYSDAPVAVQCELRECND